MKSWEDFSGKMDEHCGKSWDIINEIMGHHGKWIGKWNIIFHGKCMENPWEIHMGNPWEVWANQ